MKDRVLGEYWITDCGEVLFADGDVGPDGHETHALAHARVLLLDALGAGSLEDPADARQWARRLAGEIGMDPEGPPGRDWIPPIRDRAAGLGRDPGECAALFGVALDVPGAGDPREFAMREWGWIWVRGQDVALWALDREGSCRLRAGLLRVLDEEGIEDPGAEDIMEFEIRLASSGRRLCSTIDGLRAERPRAAPGAYDLDFPAARMAERMDRESLAPCYRGVIGG